MYTLLIAAQDWQWPISSLLYLFFIALPYYYQIKRIRLAIARNWVVKDAADEARILMYRTIVNLLLTIFIIGVYIIPFFYQKEFKGWYWIIVVVPLIFLSNRMWKAHLYLEYLKNQTSEAKKYWGEE